MAKEQIESDSLQNTNGSSDSGISSIISHNGKLNSTPTTSKTSFDESSTKGNPHQNGHILIGASIEDDDDSSVIISESESEEMEMNSKRELQNYSTALNSSTRAKMKHNSHNNILVPSTVNTIITGDNIEAHAVAPHQKPQIGSIAVQNSSDITFGNKTYYQGPVVIKQFLLDPNEKRKLNENGVYNGGYERDGVSSFNPDDDKTTQPREEKQKDTSFKNYFSLNKRLFLIVVAMSATALISIILLIIYFSSSTKLGDGDDDRRNIPIKSEIGHYLSSGTSVLRLVDRDQWIAQPPNNKLTLLELPVHRVIIAHTATEFCETQAACTFRVRTIQTYHIESRNFDDIGYNFLVGGDGATYEGRGWDQQGAHTKGYNTDSICIAFIGTFNKVQPEKRQLDAAKILIQEGLRLKKISPDYKLYGHRQLIASESPGNTLFDIIKTWPHWENTTNFNR